MDKYLKPTTFFAQNPVFRYEEFLSAHSVSGGRSKQTTNAVLKQHVASGNLLHIRRGLYAVVPRGIQPEQMPVDPYVIASKLTADAVVAYHAALQYHGKAHSIWRRFHYLTENRGKGCIFRDMEFIPVQVPVAVRSLPDFGGGILETPVAGSRIRITTLERTLVDVMDSPEKCGDWEEIWRSLETIEYFDLDAVISYVGKLGMALTAARVGFFLEQHRDRLMVEDSHLERLQALAPTQARYFDKTRRIPGKLEPRWNLIVPKWVLTREWEETADVDE